MKIVFEYLGKSIVILVIYLLIRFLFDWFGAREVYGAQVGTIIVMVLMYELDMIKRLKDL